MEMLNNRLQKSSNCSFWEQFYFDFLNHVSDFNKLSEWTHSAMSSLHLQLLFNKQYVQALKNAENKIISHQRLITSIFKSDFIQVKLISINPDQSLPLHDHPGTSGSMIVISGKVNAISCEQEQRSNQLSRNKLKIMGDVILSSGGSSCFTESQHNIHSFKSLTERSVMMNVHINPFPRTQQSFFFPVSLHQNLDTHLMVQRVQAQSIENFHQNLKEASNEANLKAAII